MSFSTFVGFSIGLEGDTASHLKVSKLVVWFWEPFLLSFLLYGAALSYSCFFFTFLFFPHISNLIQPVANFLALEY